MGITRPVATHPLLNFLSPLQGFASFASNAWAMLLYVASHTAGLANKVLLIGRAVCDDDVGLRFLSFLAPITLAFCRLVLSLLRSLPATVAVEWAAAGVHDDCDSNGTPDFSFVWVGSDVYQSEVERVVRQQASGVLCKQANKKKKPLIKHF